MKGPIIYTAVAAMTLQQALATMGGLTVPLLAPPIAAETGLNPSLVGRYTAFLYGGATISSLIGGGFLLRYGALRLSQVCLLVISLGLLLSLSSSLLLFVFGAIIIGLGLGPATPASSQILARYANRCAVRGHPCRLFVTPMRFFIWLARCHFCDGTDGNHPYRYTSTTSSGVRLR